ncbi:MAG: hypothetical protein HeimC2_36940 [Candidatus Heimdallarchaeota archaeon LC_2]|nr:MAG: hypothetical protein HeimC2_44810 [Candidatus Heimdallarchaeota archaeon LC_2]OLS20536.1 MAG: hypothetical protein HeimC2_36940 [Candidatus Heimdallarchaeota archaeon LC_2]
MIFGPPAVGKMTVGFELAKLTGLKLFHNHMTIEILLNFFDFGTEPFNRLTMEFRKRIFEEVANSELRGLIFTYVWGFDVPSDKAEVDEFVQVFTDIGADVYFVELEAKLEERLRRNKTEFRLNEKKSKRKVDESEARLLKLDKTHIMNTNNNFYYPENYLKIENSDLSARDVAKLIIKHFEIEEISFYSSSN